MFQESNNLLLKLHRYSHRQDENFITESFLHLLIHLIELEPKVGIILLNKLSANKILWSEKESKRISIQSQIKTDEGIPDIEIRSIDKLMYVEVKIESDFGYQQIKRYKSRLKKSKYAHTNLTVLTKYPYLGNSALEEPDSSFRWHQIVDWIDALVDDVENDISLFIINQFVNFLKMKGMVMEKISWELVNGIHSFNSIMVMLKEAISANKLKKVRMSGGKTWYGYIVTMKNWKFDIGIYLNEPSIIKFNSHTLINNSVKTKLKFGYLKDEVCWINDLDLTDEKIHFFARTKHSQVQCLEKFIKDSVEYGSTLV